jgi:cell division protein FtsA
LRELAGQMLDKRVRIGRPSGIAGLAELSEDPAFATVIGLVQFARLHSTGTNGFGAGGRREKGGVVSRLSGWLRGDR